MEVLDQREQEYVEAKKIVDNVERGKRLLRRKEDAEVFHREALKEVDRRVDALIASEDELTAWVDAQD
jgi:hypothetical protein